MVMERLSEKLCRHEDSRVVFLVKSGSDAATGDLISVQGEGIKSNYEYDH